MLALMCSFECHVDIRGYVDIQYATLHVARRVMCGQVSLWDRARDTSSAAGGGALLGLHLGRVHAR